MGTAPNASLNSGVSLVTTAETVVATTAVRAVNAPGTQGQVVSGFVNVTAGTGTTAVAVAVRAGATTAAPLVGNPRTHTLAAGANACIAFGAIDPTVAGNVQYSVTVQQTGATGNGTANVGLITEQTANATGA